MPGDIFGLRTNSSKIYDKQVEDNWPESANYGYFCGGLNYRQNSPPIPSNSVNIVDRLDYKTDVVSKPSSTLPIDISSSPTVFNKNYGYLAGGYRTGQPVPERRPAAIQRIDFSNEVVNELTSVLSEGRSGQGQCSTDYYGYFVGGYAELPTAGNVCTVDRINFSTETVDVPPVDSQSTSSRGSVNSRGGGIFDSNYGYFGGGRKPTTTPPSLRDCTIDRIEFATETIALPPTGNQLTQARSSIGEVKYVENYGYFACGHGPPTHIPPGGVGGHVARMEFSNETMTVIAQDLPYQRGYVAGTYDSNYGYFGGGLRSWIGGTCNIDRIDFSTDTISNNPQRTLSLQKYNVSGISGGKSISAKGFKKYKTDIDGKPTSTTYGYFVGGYSFPGYDNDVDRLDYHTGSMSESGAYPSYMGSMGTVSNLNYGYFAGGERPGPPANTAAISRMDFSNESYSAVNNNLPSERDSIGGVSNSNYGYFAGGFPHPPGSIDRMDFSNESISSAKNSLPTEVSAMAVSMTPNYGYFVGGEQPTSSYSTLISKIDFFNETVSTPGNNLTEGRYHFGGVTDSNYGYFGAGHQGPSSLPVPSSLSNKVERMDLSNETISSPGNNLSQNRGGVAATSDSSYGYFGGGVSPYLYPNIIDRNTVDSIDMSSGTVSPSSGLTKSRRNAAALSN